MIDVRFFQYKKNTKLKINKIEQFRYHFREILTYSMYTQNSMISVHKYRIHLDVMEVSKFTLLPQFGVVICCAEC